MIKQMSKKQLAVWKDNVVDYACRMTVKFDINEASARVWRFYGCPSEVKNGKIIIWFGKESVAV